MAFPAKERHEFDQHLQPLVWLVLAISKHSLERVKSQRIIGRIKSVHDNDPDINHVWVNRLSLADQMRLECAFQEQKCRVERGVGEEKVIVDEVMFKTHLHWADLSDASHMTLNAIGPGKLSVAKKLRRVTRFLSRVKCALFEDGFLVGEFERPYDQPFPNFQKYYGLASARRYYPRIWDEDFPFAAVPFRVAFRRDRKPQFGVGDFVSYGIERVDDHFEAADIRAEYPMQEVGCNSLSRNLSWDRRDCTPFMPERFLGVVWQIRCMYETDAERMQIFKALGTLEDSHKLEFLHTAKYFWKSVKPKDSQAIEWIYQKHAAKQMKRGEAVWPWFQHSDACMRETFIDFEEMLSYVRSSNDGRPSNVQRIRRVDCFESKVVKLETVDGCTVAWLERSSEMPEFFDADFEHLPLVIESTDETLRGLKTGEWLRYAVEYKWEQPFLAGYGFYAHSGERMHEAGDCQMHRQWMGTLSCFRKVEFTKRLAVDKLMGDVLKCKAKLKPTAIARADIDALIGNVKSLLRVCESALGREESEEFERKLLCDWNVDDVHSWLTQVNDGAFRQYYTRIRRRLEVHKIIGATIDRLLDPLNAYNMLQLDSLADATRLSKNVELLLKSRLDSVE